MKRTILRFILVQFILGVASAHAEQNYSSDDSSKDKKVVAVDFGANEDDLEPTQRISTMKKSVAQSQAGIGMSVAPEKKYKSDKNFGTENDGSYRASRNIASIDKEKAKPISLKKALKMFKRQSDRDLHNNYED